MSTDHVLIEKKPLVISVLESSCEFTLEVEFRPDQESITLCRLTADDLVKIARNLIQIASYNVEDGDRLLRKYNMLGYSSESLIVK
jgi:hypothetical protein